MSHCVAATKSGKPCRWQVSADSTSGLCERHGDPVAYSARMRIQGKAARAQQVAAIAERRELGRVESVNLRSIDANLALLERCAVGVLNSDESPAAKSKEVRGIIGVAVELLRAGELSDENRQLKALLIEHHPQLGKTLRALP